MFRAFLVVAVVGTIGSSLSFLSAQPIGSPGMGLEPKNQPKSVIVIGTPNAWTLSIFSDGSGWLQCGANADEGWPFKAGTIDVVRAEKDLRALVSDPKGGSNTHFTFFFEVERKGPLEAGPSRCTRDVKVIPALLKAAVDATAGRNADNVATRAERLKTYPPAELPK